MKTFVIFLIICSLGVPTIFGKPSAKSLDLLRQCRREMNITSDSATPKDNCELACTFRKATINELIGSNHKATLYSGYLKAVDNAYKAGLGDDRNYDFTRADVINKIEHCYTSEQTECGFFTCVDIYESPMEHVFFYKDANQLEIIYDLD